MKITDLFGKFLELFSKLQTVLFLIVFVSFVLSLMGNGCQRSDLISITEKLTGIKLENDFLVNENKEKAFQIQKLRNDSIVLAIKYDSLLNLKNSYAKTNSNYRKKITDLEAELVRVGEDSAYQWTQLVGYPFGGNYKPFGFNGPQVKAIMADKIHSQVKDSLIAGLGNELKKTEEMLITKDDMYRKKSEESILLEAANRNYEVISGNKAETLKIKDQEIKKVRREKMFWKFTTVLSAIGAIILVSL